MNPLWKNTPDKIGQLIPTLNQQGFMTTVLDPYTNAFIHSLSGSKDPVLEIGTAYGIATLAMLNNNIHVIANDLEKKHLDIMKDNVPKEHSHLIEYRSGDFRNLTIANNSLAGILTNSKYKDKLPDFINLQSPETLRHATEKQGFKVKELGFCARPDYPDDVRLDGRENIGIICIKPNPLPLEVQP